MSLRTLLLGRPFTTEEDDEQRVGPLTGIPILGLDALGSAAYGPEALLTVLLPLGAAAVWYMPPLTLVIVALLAVVFVSYRQTIHAYPGGGGAYTVAKENLGTTPSLFAASALAIDYVLNVAVAASAGVGAIVSAVPALLPHTLALCLAIVAIITTINLRGVRTTGLAFALPAYLFVGCLFLMVGVGAHHALTGSAHPSALSTTPPPMSGPVSTWLLVRAFASGCTAMTGVEAVSNAVPIFRKPATVGATRTLTAIIAILVVLLLGEAFLCHAFVVTATNPGAPGYESVLSRLLTVTVGRGPLYYVAIGTIASVLALSANTSFAGFPRLCRVLGADHFLPETFVHRGRRLALSSGILVLSALATVLLVVFGGVTDRLIPLFAVGAFFAFTMSQAGMVMHWRKQSGARAKRALVLNACGAGATAATLAVVLVSKFEEGAWITVLLAGAMIVVFFGVRRHHDFVARVTACDVSLEISPPRRPLAVVPLRAWDAVALKGLRFAIGFAADVVAVQVLTPNRTVDDLTPRWRDLAVVPAERLGLRPPKLVVLPSDYRELFGPLLRFVTSLAEENPDRQVAVVLPELVEPRWYHFLLHNHSASILRALLLFRGGPQIVVVSTPWYLADWLPERRSLFRWRPRVTSRSRSSEEAWRDHPASASR